jgi:hypothetical protein
MSYDDAPHYERSQSAESASQANMDKFYDTNAPGITLNDKKSGVQGTESHAFFL